MLKEKLQCGNFVIQPLVTETMISNSEAFAEQLFNEEKTKYYRTEDQKISLLPPKPKKSMKKLTHSFLLRNEISHQIDDIKAMNKPFNEKLEAILKEEDCVIANRNSRKLSDSFDFKAFEATQTSNNQKRPPFPSILKAKKPSSTKNISFSQSPSLNYAEIIRSKAADEAKAKSQVATLKQSLKDKRDKYDSINKKVQELFKAYNDNKINYSRCLDLNINKLQEIKALQRDSISQLVTRGNTQNLLNESHKSATQINNNIQIIYRELNDNDLSYKKEINDFINQLKDLHVEIKETQLSLNESISQCVQYYLEILANGIDTRNEGFSWIVKRLIEMDYEVKPENFPAFFDPSKIGFIVRLSRLQLEKESLIAQLKELKEKLVSIKGQMLKSNSHQILKPKLKSIEKKKTRIIQPNAMLTRNDSNKSYANHRVYGFIEKYQFKYVTPQEEKQIKKCLLFSNVIKYKATEKLQLDPMVTRAHSVYGNRNDRRISKIALNSISEQNKEQLALLKRIIAIKQKIKLNEEEIDAISQAEMKEFREKYKSKMYMSDRINKLSSALFGNKLLVK